jgi:hypothetical protein
MRRGVTQYDVPLELLDLAESFRQYTERALGHGLDYCSETLPLMDAYLDAARGDLGALAEAEPLVARAGAAYFGEVVRRLISGFWRYQPGDMLQWEVCSTRAFCAVRPAVVVLEALRQAAVEQPMLRLDPADAAVVEQRLGALPQVDEAEYYRPSTRYDAVEIAFASLTDAVTPGVETTYEPDDYAELD